MFAKKALRKTGLILAAVIATALLANCNNPIPSKSGDIIQYTTYRQIPGITSEEIQAIDKIRSQYGSLVFGSVPNTETFYTENGKIGGYSALLAGWLSGLLEIPFTPKLYGWGDLLEGMKSGAIDFNGDLTPSDERRTSYFMTSPIAQRTLKYFRIAGSPSLSEIEKTRPPRFIFFKGSLTSDRVRASGAYAKFDSLYILDDKSAYELLKSGKADALVEESVAEAIFDDHPDIVTSDFYPLIFSPVSLATQNPELEPIITVVQKALDNGASQYLTQIYNQGHQEYLKRKLFSRLSDTEKAWLRTNPQVTLAAEYDNYPYCFYNIREKQWQGISFDVMAKIEEFTGLKFHVINNNVINWPDMVQMLEDKKVSMLTELIRIPSREGRFLWPEHTILTDNYALLSKMEYPNINANEILFAKIGLPRDTAYTLAFKNWFPDHTNTVEFENSDAAFTALERGDIDMVMSSQYRFLLLTNFRELPGYKANYVFDCTFSTTFGFNKDEAILCSIVDKALAMIDTQGISGQWMSRTYDYRAKMAQGQIPWIVGTTALLFIFLLSIIIFIIDHRDKQQLETTVQIRTAEILKMVKKQTETEAASVAKSAFLANMSHEIRTPMNSIVGFAELAMDSEISPIAREYLDMIKENANWLLQIINDILDISKVESGNIELETIPFDLRDLLISCKSMIMPRAVEKNISLQFNAAVSINRKLLGDPTKLRQVLLNLLSNAVKFTDTGSVKLTITVEKETWNSITLRFEVKDSGIGMSDKQIQRIFEPFMQGDISTTRKYGGTGLGLTITKKMLDLMGSSLAIESEPGVGTMIIFELTFEMTDVTDQTAESVNAISELDKPSFEGDILVCEDNQMNQRVITEHLARVGLHAVIAENGREGIDKV